MARSRNPILQQRPSPAATTLVARSCLLAALTAGIMATGLPGEAHAQQGATGSTTASRRHYDIPGGNLDQVLNRFASEAGAELSVDSSLTQGKTSTGLVGNFTVEEGFDALLQGQGLQVVRGNNGAWSLRAGFAQQTPAAASASSPMLPAVVVSGKAAPDEPPRPYPGGQVARGGRVGLLGDRNVMDTPFNTTSYTSETMANQQARSVSDVLNNDPSVRSVWSQGSYADEFFIRGFQVLNTDIAWDGLYGILPGQLVGPEYAERVEVIKGATALLTGISPSGAIGGGINVVPKRATDDPVTSVTATYGSRAQFGTRIDIGRRFGPDNEWGIRFNGSFRDGDTAASDQFQRLGAAVFGLDYRGDRLRVSLDAGYQNQRFDGDMQPVWPASGFPIPSPPKATRNFLPSWAYSKSQDTFGALHAEYDLTSNWTAFAAVGGRDNKNQQLQTQPVLLNSAGDLDLGPDFFANRANTVTGQAGIRGTFNTGPIKNQLSLVADYYREEDGFSLFYPTDIFSSLYHPTNAPAPGPDGYAFDTPTNAIKRNSSLAVADTASILDGRFQLTVGVRRQRVNSDNFDTDSGDVTSHYSRSATSPAVALLIKPLQNVSVYANYIQGLQQGPTAPIGAVNAGQVFSPFVSKQYEVGTKIDFGRIAATLDAFQIQQPNGVTHPETLIFGVDGQQRNRGIELDIFGEASRHVRVLGGVTLMNGVLSGTGDASTEGNTAVGVPHTLLNFGAEWDTPFIDNLTLSGLVVYTSPQYVDVANTQKLPGWTRFDVGARYVIYRRGGKPVVLRANVENVFNRAYWAAAAPNYGIALGGARTVLLSAQFDF